jgi:hypothetical protein
MKSLTTFSLLFGSTWLVNSLVFFAILTSVFLAILVNRRFKIKVYRLVLRTIVWHPCPTFCCHPKLCYWEPGRTVSPRKFTGLRPVFWPTSSSHSFRDSEASDIAFA